MRKLSLIFSDIEAGCGTRTDDFVEEELFCETLRNHFPDTKKFPTDLILNGDIFDTMKAPYKGKYVRHITEEVALWKYKEIYKAHRKLFKTWTAFLKADKRTRIIFIIGNHDFDMIYPKVQERIKDFIAGKNTKTRERIIFPGFEFTDRQLIIEHGSQLDNWFAVDEKKLIYSPRKKGLSTHLMLPWGFNANFEHFVLIKEKVPIIEQCFPRTIILAIAPFKYKWKLLIGTSWYMLKSFFYTQFKHWDDRLYRFHPKEFYKYFESFLKKEYTLQIIGNAKRKIRRGKYKVIAVGHNHLSALHRTRNRIVLNTGPWRDEYSYVVHTRTFVPKQKSYGYVLQDKNSIEPQLIRVPSRMPELSVKEVRAMLKSKINSRTKFVDRTETRQNSSRRKQE